MSSSYIETSSIKVFNSNLLSTLTSVGLHSLALFLIVPHLTNLSNPAEPEISDQRPRNVQVIELNPTEQSRLPEQNSALSNIPEFPNSTLGDLPVLDSPSLGSSFSNLPAPPALPPLPPLPPLTPYNNYSRIPIAPPPRSIPFPPSSIRRSPLPPPSLQPPIPKNPPVENPQTSEKPSPRPIFDGQTVAPVNHSPFTHNPPNPEQTELKPNTPSLPSNTNSNGNRDDKILEGLMADGRRAVDALMYNSNGTTRKEAGEKDREWIRETGITDISRKLVPITGNYPKAACNRKLEGSAVYNVVVNSNGQVVGQPYMTQSSGYGLLNNQGLQQVQALTFPKATRVKVTFRYDPSVCPQGLRQGENTKQPQPASSPQTQPNQTPKTPPENKTPNQPAPSPQTQPNQPPKTPPENKTPNPPSDSKGQGVLAPPVGKK